MSMRNTRAIQISAGMTGDEAAWAMRKSGWKNVEDAFDKLKAYFWLKGQGKHGVGITVWHSGKGSRLQAKPSRDRIGASPRSGKPVRAVYWYRGKKKELRAILSPEEIARKYGLNPSDIVWSSRDAGVKAMGGRGMSRLDTVNDILDAVARKFYSSGNPEVDKLFRKLDQKGWSGLDYDKHNDMANTGPIRGEYGEVTLHIRGASRAGGRKIQVLFRAFNSAPNRFERKTVSDIPNPRQAGMMFGKREMGARRSVSIKGISKSEVSGIASDDMRSAGFRLDSVEIDGRGYEAIAQGAGVRVGGVSYMVGLGISYDANGKQTGWGVSVSDENYDEVGDFTGRGRIPRPNQAVQVALKRQRK